MRCKIITLFPIAAAALVLTGCGGSKAQMATGETNILGLYKNAQESYAPTSPNSFTIKSDELFTRKNFSGDKTTLLWGLITIEDY